MFPFQDRPSTYRKKANSFQHTISVHSRDGNSAINNVYRELNSARYRSRMQGIQVT